MHKPTVIHSFHLIHHETTRNIFVLGSFPALNGNEYWKIRDS